MTHPERISNVELTTAESTHYPIMNHHRDVQIDNDSLTAPQTSKFIQQRS